MSDSPSSPLLDVLIVGAGFGGLAAAVALWRAKQSFLVLERAQTVGGTWRDNIYPGCACDVPSPLYSFSFAPNPHWSRLYATQPEIHQYLEHVATRFDVRSRIRFGRTFCGARFDAARALWQVDTLEGESFAARALILATGGLTRPFTPSLPGAEQFQGKQMHSARWDASYDLSGKRVAVIGTGASAIQIVPAIAGRTSHVDVYQRTPPWVLPKPDRAMRAWQRQLFRWLPFTQRFLRERIFQFNESLGKFILGERDIAQAESFALRFLEREVAEPALRAKLKPEYALGCKRVLFSNDWYSTLQSPNVELITAPIERIAPHGIVASDGGERPADCIVYCTGFDVHGIAKAPIIGLDGADLSEVWQRRREAYLGCTVAGFPNLFIVIGPNSGTGHNSLVYVIECQVSFIMKALRSLRRKRARWLHPKPAAQQAFNAALQQRLATTTWTQGHCHSWYQDPEGRITTLWPGSLMDYRKLTQVLDEDAFEWQTAD